MDPSITFEHNHEDGLGELDKAKTKHENHHHHLQFSISNLKP